MPRFDHLYDRGSDAKYKLACACDELHTLKLLTHDNRFSGVKEAVGCRGVADTNRRICLHAAQAASQTLMCKPFRIAHASFG
jgi:hypothetical protein